MKAKILHLLVMSLLLNISDVLAQTPQIQVNLQPNKTYSQAIANSMQQLSLNRVPYDVLYDRVIGWSGINIWNSSDTTSKSHLLQAWWDLENSQP